MKAPRAAGRGASKRSSALAFAVGLVVLLTSAAPSALAGLASSPLGYYQEVQEASRLSVETQQLFDSPAHDVPVTRDPSNDLVPDPTAPKLARQLEGGASTVEAFNVPVGHSDNRPLTGSLGEAGAVPPANATVLLNHGVSEVLGTDNQPFLLIGKLSYRAPTGGGCVIASGFMARDFHMLASGHTVFNLCNDEWRTGFRVGLAQTDRVWPRTEDSPVNFIPPFARIDYPQGVMRVQAKWTIPEWQDQAPCCCSGSFPDYDWGMLTLDRPMGERVGWMGQDDDSPSSLTLTAYPNSAAFGSDGSRQQTRTDTVSNWRRRSIEVAADVAGGDCGGPWYRNTGGPYSARGIQVGVSGNTAFACRLKRPRWDDFWFVIDEDEANLSPDRKPQVIEDVRNGIATKTLSKTEVERGGSYEATLPYFNAGFDSSGGIDTTFVYVTYTVDTSVNTACRTEDVRVTTSAIATHSRGGLGQGASATISKTLTAPWSTGVYLIGAIWTTDDASYTTDTNIALIGEITVVDPSCEAINDCGVCTATDGCGWCKLNGKCFELENEPAEPGDWMLLPLKCFNPATGPEPLVVAPWECSCCFEQTSCSACHAVPDSDCCWHVDHCDIAPTFSTGRGCAQPGSNACQRAPQWTPSFDLDLVFPFWPWWVTTTKKPLFTLDATPFDPNPPDWLDPLPLGQPPVVFKPYKEPELTGFLEPSDQMTFRIPTMPDIHGSGDHQQDAAAEPSQIRNFLFRVTTIMPGRLCFTSANFYSNFMVCVDHFLGRLYIMDAKHALLGENPERKLPALRRLTKYALRIRLHPRRNAITVAIGRRVIAKNYEVSSRRIYKEEARTREPTTVVIVKTESGVFQVDQVKLGLGFAGPFPFQLGDHLRQQPLDDADKPAGGLSPAAHFLALRNGARVSAKNDRIVLAGNASSAVMHVDDDSMENPVVNVFFSFAVNRTDPGADDADLKFQLGVAGDKFIPDLRFRVEISGVSAGFVMGREGDGSEALATAPIAPGSGSGALWAVQIDRRTNTLALAQDGNQVIQPTVFRAPASPGAGSSGGSGLLLEDMPPAGSSPSDMRVAFRRVGGAATTAVSVGVASVSIHSVCPAAPNREISFSPAQNQFERTGLDEDCVEWRVAVIAPDLSWARVQADDQAATGRTFAPSGSDGVCYRMRLVRPADGSVASNELFFIQGQGVVASCPLTPFALSHAVTEKASNVLRRSGSAGDCLAVRYEWLLPDGVTYESRAVRPSGRLEDAFVGGRPGICYRASLIHAAYDPALVHDEVAGYGCQTPLNATTVLSNYVYFFAGAEEVASCEPRKQMKFAVDPSSFASMRGGAPLDCVNCVWDVMQPDRVSWKQKMQRNCRRQTSSAFGEWGLCYRAHVEAMTLSGLSSQEDPVNGYGCSGQDGAGFPITPFVHFQRGVQVFGDTPCDMPVHLGLAADVDPGASGLIRGGRAGDCLKWSFASWDPINLEYVEVASFHAAGSTTLSYGQPGQCFRAFLVTTTATHADQVAGGYGCDHPAAARVSAWVHYAPGEDSLREDCRTREGVWLREAQSGVLFGEDADIGLYRKAAVNGNGARLSLVGEDLEIGNVGVRQTLDDLQARLAVLEAAAAP